MPSAASCSMEPDPPPSCSTMGCQSSAAHTTALGYAVQPGAAPAEVCKGKLLSVPWAKARTTLRWLAAAVANVHWTTSVTPWADLTGLLFTLPAASSISCHLQREGRQG